MSQEEQHALDLKAIEARLASLVPRTDRLDRERLMFLAGQASVAPSPATQRRPFGRWAWPAATAAMTAAAASLLVVLLWQGDPRIVERIVEVPVERPVPKDVKTDRERQVEPVKAESLQVPAGPHEPDSPPSRERFLVSWGLGDWRGSAGGRLLDLPLYPRTFEEILVRGLPSPEYASPAGPPGKTPAAVSYRELRADLLGGPPPEAPAPSWLRSNLLFHRRTDS